MPFRQTAAAAGRRRVLRNEHRMTAKGRLLAIVARRRWRESPRNQLLGLDEHPLQATRLQIASLGGAEVETPPKRRIGEGSKELVE